ncbi:hypothetical protein, partial [Klebsiella pneumoniae]
AFEWVHVQLHQQKGMISLSPPTICNSAEMSIPKKGSRKIIVGENEFLWLIRSKLTYSQDCLGTEMTAVVEPDAGPH